MAMAGYLIKMQERDTFSLIGPFFFITTIKNRIRAKLSWITVYGIRLFLYNLLLMRGLFLEQ